MASGREGRQGTGRPPRDPHLAHYYDTELHTFLLEKLAHVPGMIRGGRIDTKVLARRCNVARWTCYRWFRAESLSPNAAKALIRASITDETPEGTITGQDLHRFILG